MNKKEKTRDHDPRQPPLTTSSVTEPAAFSPQSLTVIDALSLFGKSREVGIQYAGSLYRLKITRHGKLILNK